MNLKNIFINTTMLLIFCAGLTFAQDNLQTLSPHGEEFLSQGSLRMISYADALDHCVSKVMSGDEKMLKIKRRWDKKYLAMSQELLHYKSIHLFENLKGTEDEESNVVSVKNKLRVLSNETVLRSFTGQSKRKMKSMCKDIQKNSMKEAREVYLIYKTVEQQILIKAYGPYDGKLDQAK